MSDLVTGDAVVLGLSPAKLPTRVLAMALDLAVTWGVYLVVTFGIVLSAGSLDDAALAALSVATFLLLLVGGPIAVETLSHGRSLGKLACGLRVVRDDGGPIRFRHALVRGAVGVVEILISFGVIACFASLVSARGRRIGDVLAGTLVVRERVPAARMAVSPPPPPWLAGRFSSLDLSAVPDDLWLAVRQYLTRMGQLDQGVGRAMAERLAGDLAQLTGAPAPHGVPPAAYLAAVIHERQARDARRAFGPHAGQGLTGQPPVGQPPFGPAGHVPDPWLNGTMAKASGEAPAAPVPAKALWHTPSPTAEPGRGHVPPGTWAAERPEPGEPGHEQSTRVRPEPGKPGIAAAEYTEPDHAAPDRMTSEQRPASAGRATGFVPPA